MFQEEGKQTCISMWRETDTVCREYTKIHDVFNVHFQNDIVTIYSVGRKTVIEEYCSKSRIPRAILTDNERNHRVLHVILLKGVAWMMISQL